MADNPMPIRLRVAKSWEDGDIYEVGTGRYIAAICRTWSTDPAHELTESDARAIRREIVRRYNAHRPAPVVELDKEQL